MVVASLMTDVVFGDLLPNKALQPTAQLPRSRSAAELQRREKAMQRMLLAALLTIGAIALAGCRHGGSASGTIAANVKYAVLDANDQPLRETFNRDRGNIRLMFLVDPICPVCLRGMADMGNDLLSKLPKNAPVKVYVVYEPVIGGRAENIPAAAALLKSSIAKNYWNPSGDFGREMSHTLGYWNRNRWVYAWDTWLIYRADATWTHAGPPKPAFLMNQLGGLHGKFPYLDGHVFTAKVNSMLATLDRKGASR